MGAGGVVGGGFKSPGARKKSIAPYGIASTADALGMSI